MSVVWGGKCFSFLNKFLGVCLSQYIVKDDIVNFEKWEKYLNLLKEILTGFENLNVCSSRGHSVMPRMFEKKGVKK